MGLRRGGSCTCFEFDSPYPDRGRDSGGALAAEGALRVEEAREIDTEGVWDWAETDRASRDGEF